LCKHYIFIYSKGTAEDVAHILTGLVPTSQKTRTSNPSKWKDALPRILPGRRERLFLYENYKTSLKDFIQNGKYQNVV